MTRKNEKGFTLIELMIVIAIIGVLAAIAIPQFSKYRTRSFNSAAQSDLRNAATSQEAYYVDEDTYANSSSNLILNYNLFLSEGVFFSKCSADADGYVMEMYHSSGNESYQINGPGGTITKK